MNRRDFNLGVLALWGTSAFAADTDSIKNLPIRLTDPFGQGQALEWADSTFVQRIRSSLI